MSTANKLLALEAEAPPRLCRVEPTLLGAQKEVRRVSALPKIRDWLYRQVKGGSGTNLKAAVRAHLGQFSRGEKVDDRDFMKRVSRRSAAGNNFLENVWSIRPHFEPQHRFFGVFAMPDWFLIFNMHKRSYLVTDQRWHAEIDKSLRTWSALLPGMLHCSGTRLSHYVTFNAEHRDDRWTEH